MKQGKFLIGENRNIASGVYRMTLTGDTSAVRKPGQFVQIKLPGLYLRRPISVCDVSDGVLTLIYKAVGVGTDAMSGMERGGELDIITGLGNGYDITMKGVKPLLVGGGVGTPPLYLLAKRLITAGKKPHIVLGFGSAADVFYADEFAALGLDVTVATMDGSYENPSVGTVRGLVTDAAGGLDYDCFYACGPLPMLRAVCEKLHGEGQLNLEERMGCGFGACMGCTIETKSGAKRVCHDGPVFRREELIW